MAPRIDPILPLVWRSPTDLQLGAVGTRVVLADAGGLETGLISALRHGASVDTLMTIGTALGGSIEEVHRILDVLRPTFESRSIPVGGTVEEGRELRAIVALDADGPIAEHLSAGLERLGWQVAYGERVADDAERVSLAVVATAWVMSPARHLPWLRRDIPHLAIVMDDEGARIGPLVEPGEGPCLRCLDLTRRDEDAAWPAIAAQLAGRPAPAPDARLELEAAVLATAMIDDRMGYGSTSFADVSVQISRRRPSLLPRRRRHEPHPDCGCRVPGGIATAPARLDGRHRPAASSATAGAVHA